MVRSTEAYVLTKHLTYCGCARHCVPDFTSNPPTLLMFHFLTSAASYTVCSPLAEVPKIAAITNAENHKSLLFK